MIMFARRLAQPGLIKFLEWMYALNQVVVMDIMLNPDFQDVLFVTSNVHNVKPQAAIARDANQIII